MASEKALEVFSNNESGPRSCWICFEAEDEFGSDKWSRPCRCKGSMKWIHTKCLYRWIDEKQKGNPYQSVRCPQCKSKYNIMVPQMGFVARTLERLEKIAESLGPVWAEGFLEFLLSCTAATYGAFTFLQIFGYKRGIVLLRGAEKSVLMVGLPAIPAVLILGRIIPWQDTIVRLLQCRQNSIGNVPSSQREYYGDNSTLPRAVTERPSPPRFIGGALLLPTISAVIGRYFFYHFESRLHRALLGGFTYIVIKGSFKIYMKLQQAKRNNSRRVADYNSVEVRRLLQEGRQRRPPNVQPANINPQIVGADGIQVLADFIRRLHF